MKTVVILGLITLAGCGNLPGPSVPMQPGQTLHSAREAVRACAVHAPQGGNEAVFGGYVTGVLLGGVLLGPIVVAANQDNIKAHGEAGAVDRCLAKRGFVRRDLTGAEVATLDRADATTRRAMLDHLIAGGTLESFPAARFSGI